MTPKEFQEISTKIEEKLRHYIEDPPGAKGAQEGNFLEDIQHKRAGFSCLSMYHHDSRASFMELITQKEWL
ncbi:hypothetical protein L6164_028451 [Bauhinia variegata]|uniref:Uncharacterized protein n=1 Tax=Bauhinia variegata TaxID=167791 RepID=A0ACB9L6W8_BAUVA|nr:hypothetical protein L6164_028451 [Bauhinia variegata]